MSMNFKPDDIKPDGIDDNPNDLDSAAEREAYFQGIHLDPNLAKYSPNDIHLNVVNSGNEETYDMAGEYIGGASGRASQHNNVLAGNVDDNQQALDKSVADEMKSKDLAAGSRIESGVENDVLDESNPAHNGEDMDMPVTLDKQDMNPAIAAIYMALSAFGIFQGQLNEAMGANGPDDDRATLAAFYEMAEEAGLGDLAEYIKDSDEFAMHMQMEDGMKDVSPAIGTEPDPEPEATTPEQDLLLAQQLEQQVELGGPTAPTAMKPG